MIRYMAPPPVPVRFPAIPGAMGITFVAEMLVQYRQADIGQKRGNDPSLRGPGVGFPDLPLGGHDARLEELPDQGRSVMVVVFAFSGKYRQAQGTAWL